MIKMFLKGFELLSHNKWSRERVLKYSERKMREIVKYAYNSSRFYKKFYTEHGIKEKDLDVIPIEELPMIDKDLVRDNFFEIITGNISMKDIENAIKSDELMVKVGKYILVHTSGSTGKPCNFLYDEEGLDTIEANMVRISVGGKNSIELKDFPIKVLYIAAVGSGYAATTLAMSGIKKYKAKSIVVDIKEPIDTWKGKIESFKPVYVAGYPSCVKILADMKEKGEIDIKPKKVITGGEPLNKEVKEYLASVFDADIIDYYGCTESIFLGMGSSWYEGMYLMDDMNYVEVDELSRLIITPLYNKAFPLIRYRLKDVVEGFDKFHKGVLPYTYIKRVVGREEEMMWFKNEKRGSDFLHPLFIDDLDVQGLKEYQFIKTSEESFVLNCVKFDDYSSDIEKQIRRQIDEFLMKKRLRNVRYEIRFVKELQIDKKTGKAKMVIDYTKDRR
ncbi:AMP-binding protein [Caldanaerobacter subterraneus KAk]|uniref:phenylacetate--CoA ligase family protein n=1 Tax=Caldanaerobacter subterraneus TaxID=911092 RepID=UPI0032BFAD56